MDNMRSINQFERHLLYNISVIVSVWCIIKSLTLFQQSIMVKLHHTTTTSHREELISLSHQPRYFMKELLQEIFL